MYSLRSSIISIRFLLLLLLLTLPVITNYFFGWFLEKENEKFLLTLLFILSSTLFVMLVITNIRYKILKYIIASIVITPVFLAELLRLLSYYLQQESFNERFFFHFNINTFTEAGGAYSEVIVLFVIVLVLMQLVLYWNSVRFSIKQAAALYSLLVTMAVMLLCVHQSAAAEFYNALKDNFVSDDVIQISELDEAALQRYQSMGININAIKQDKIESTAGRNLVFIYLESLESIYSDPEVFTDLTPEINKLKANGLNFNNIYQTLGTGWTIAGMVASQCGTPLLLNTIKNSNDAMSEGFFNKAVCLGDILKQAGYEQSYMGGATIKFAGKGKFYKQHAYDSVKGVDELLKKTADPEYKNAWGLFDDSLFDLALDEYRRLAQLGKPFNLTLLTIDTHHPDGDASKSCKPYPKIKNSILNAVYCTDQLVHRFLAKLAQEPQFAETLVVLMSDHLAMRNNAYALFPEDYERKMLFTLLNSEVKGNNLTSGTHMDVAPTILDALGVDYNTRFLLGESLLQKKQAGKVANFANEAVLQAIREINTNYYSYSNINICKKNNLLKYVKNDRLMLGNQLIDLKFGGYTLPVKDFKGDIALVAVIDKKGTVKSFSMTDNNAIPGIVYNELNHYLLIVTAARELPWNMEQKLSHKEGTYAIIFGRAPDDFKLLAEVRTLDQLNINNNICQTMLKAGSRTIEQQQNKLLNYYMQHCTINNSDNIPHYSSKTGELYIPDLSGTYSVILEKNKEQFIAVTHDIHNAQFESRNKKCMPVLTDHSMFFPVVSIDDSLHYLIEMKRIGTFAVKIKEEDEKSF